MAVTAAEFRDAGNTIIKATIDGVILSVPVDAGNRHYQQILEEAFAIDAFVAPPAPTPLTNVQILEEHTGLSLADIKTVLGI